ncbi:unnamed protein product [Staurois parvus]|uniref:Uncharacterized protein n=1 Tax=Staurois parvus TaxID=386267 RepID=A0ABN9CMW7_9NEOB|nr:unnamed protein product [Staurois parvus]
MGSAVQRIRQKDGQASQGLNRRWSATMQRSATEDRQRNRNTGCRYRGSWETTPRH